MKEWSLQAVLKVVLAAIIAGAATVFGGWSPGMTTLVIFIALDIISGWTRAIIQKELSSAESFKGIAKKLLIFVMIAVAAQADRLVGTDVMLNGAIVFYCGSEALSIMENVTAAGLPIPDFLRQVFVKTNSKKFKED